MVITRSFGPRTTPLTTAERKKVLNSLEDATLEERFSTLLYLYTGVEAYAGSHIRAKMVSPTSDGISITLQPGTHECKTGGATGNIVRDWSEPETDACSFCSDNDSNGYEFKQPRVIPVRDDTAAKLIGSWFETYDHTPHVATMRRNIHSVGRKVGLERKLTPIVLRHSFGVMLAEKQFSREAVKKVMGYQSDLCDLSSQILGYGDYVDGENPYLCGVETNSGTPCKKGAPVNGQCHIHRGEKICGFQRDDGSVCKGIVVADGRCQAHQEDRHMCGAETVTTSERCSIVVLSPDERCHIHREDWYRCGAETSSYSSEGVCSNPVSSPNEQCHLHKENQHYCGADMADGVHKCSIPVSSPDDFCSFHT